MKFVVPLAAATMIAALALTGCSAGGLPGGIPGVTGTGTAGSGSASGAEPGRTYTGNDLIAILRTIAADRGIAVSKISGLARSKAYVKADISGPDSTTITKNFTADGGVFAPASCAKVLNPLGLIAEKKIAQDGWQGAALVVGEDQITVATAPSAADSAAVPTETASIVNRLTSQCPAMSITNGSAIVAFTVRSTSATTNGNGTFAYREVQKYQDGTSDVGETVETSYGNLFIAVISATPKLAELEANVNAVIAAAKG